jgi:hypothetical protein
MEDKAQLETLLSETQRHLVETERQLADNNEKLESEIRSRKLENEEWEQFQQDLLVSVRVANDFKTEAQLAHEQMALDNKLLRDKVNIDDLSAVICNVLKIYLFFYSSFSFAGWNRKLRNLISVSIAIIIVN